MVRGSARVIRAGKGAGQTGQKEAIRVLIFYRYQKIRVFGAKKNRYQLLLINNLLYLHIEKTDTKIIC